VFNRVNVEQFIYHNQILSYIIKLIQHSFCLLILPSEVSNITVLIQYRFYYYPIF